MIQLVTDSMSDIRQEEAGEKGITVLPQPVLFGQDTYMDGVTITCAQFYEKLSRAKALPKTSQVSPEAFSTAFAQALEEGKQVVCVPGSSKLSGSYQGAMLARGMVERPEDIFVVDSLNASLGQQLLLEHALTLRDRGCTGAEAAAALQALVPRIQLVGHTSNLKHLVMGGRLHAATARIGHTLNLKPTLRLKEGRLGQDSLTRGSRRANEWILAQMQAATRDEVFPVYLASSNAPQELDTLEKVLAGASALGQEVRRVEIGAIIGTHTGPGIVAAAWVAQ